MDKNIFYKIFGRRIVRRRVVRRRVIRRSRPRLTRRDYIKNKEAARVLVHERVAFYVAQYKLLGVNLGSDSARPFRKIFIKNQKTRWGSCSANRNLNFNYKIVFLTPEQRDYIIVHELCHLGEFNHSRRFWALVAKACPEYARLRRELRRHDVTKTHGVR